MLLYQTLVFTINGEILSNGSHSVSDLQDYFKYIIKKHDTVTDYSSIMIYVNKKENRMTFKTKTGYYFELSMPVKMKLLGNTNSKLTKDENSENVPHLEITEVVLIQCKFVNSDY